MASTVGAGYDASAAASAAFDFKLYRYTPSLPAAVVFAVFFAVLAALHTWRLLRHRAYYFTTFTVGGYFQLIGYCGRIWSHFDPLSIGGFVMQAILILVAPALYAASIYMILGRLIRTLQADSFSLLPIAWATKIFVLSDIVSFTLQAGGGGIQAAGTLDLYEIGEKIIIAGLFVQIAMFGFFIATAVLFHVRYARGQWRSAADDDDSNGNCGLACNKTTVQWRRHLWVLYTGNRGYLIAHEVFLYVFDAALMALVMATFLVCYVDDLDAAQGHRGGSDCTLSEIQG
ncbi:RTA1 domain-containing protein [Apiospora kogelbergensis]|uniref:RTA1 domain-containing protein n=1 Tax=Apiospora kogelbergensis TaxID=1337665 RepID=UPI00312FFA09